MYTLSPQERIALAQARIKNVPSYVPTIPRTTNTDSRYADIEREQQQQKRLEEQQQMQLLASLQSNVKRGAIDKISLDEYLNAGAIEENDYNRLLDMYRSVNFENIQGQIDTAVQSANFKEEVSNTLNFIEEQKKAGGISKEQYNDTYRYYYEAIIPYINISDIEDVINEIKTNKTQLPVNC